uniref:Uncharacterized protein n=1 Tax=Rangifer tarandus platyrhynchus TaxID=3082113 RepID=A0ACB0E048_RANTA|nr:unnamed protein product [Rangifer tarandus platyrhynchus]
MSLVVLQSSAWSSKAAGKGSRALQRARLRSSQPPARSRRPGHLGENGAPSPLRPGTCSRRDPARAPARAHPRPARGGRIGTETAGRPADQRRLRVEVRTNP